MNVRQLLSDRSCTCLRVVFGRDSEFAAFKAPDHISVGLAIRGRELRAEKAIFDFFNKDGCVLVHRTPRLKLLGKSVSTYLLRFDQKSKFLRAAEGLKHWAGKDRFLVRDTKPVLVSDAVFFRNKGVAQDQRHRKGHTH